MRSLNLFKNVLFAFALFALASSPVFAGFCRYGIPDSSEIRESCIDTWLSAPIPQVLSQEREVKDDGSSIFQISADAKDGSVRIVVAPQSLVSISVINGRDNASTSAVTYPEDAPGSWILYRDTKTGKPQKIRLYFNRDKEVYAEIRNSSGKVYADMIIFGSYAASSVPLGIRFTKLYSMTFDELMDLTKRSLPWNEVSVVPGQYHSKLQMSAIIRQVLPKITPVDDACYNQNGELYSIKNSEPFAISAAQAANDPALARAKQAMSENGLVMSQAGFLKWITDGLLRPVTGKMSNPDNVIQKTVAYDSLGKKGILSQEWNVSFTLDWCRNLAVEILNSSPSKTTYEYKMGNGESTGVDVSIQPFVKVKRATLSGKNSVKSAGYIKDSGYSLEELKALLYVLAVTEPQHAYFAAIKSRSTVNFDASVFGECFAIFPYFDDNGKFDCFVFDAGREMTLDDFIQKQGAETFVHFNRFKTSDYFDPMPR